MGAWPVGRAPGSGACLAPGPHQRPGCADPGLQLVNLNLHWRQRTAQGEWMVFAALNNLGNQLAYNASSVESMRFLAPLPGRSLRIGAQWGF
ncbi:MAG: TonB-dependent receptor [Burkholderiaceae bacterium]|nr:MAG: TonB-dependent receptor [Burkholderiaceae bacterium]